MLGKLAVRGERLIKLSDSWFFAKSIEVERFRNCAIIESTLKNIAITSKCVKETQNVYGMFMYCAVRLFIGSS